MKSVLKYPGAKTRLAPWIVSHIPEHKVYLEPFAGSLSVLFNKPRCHIETVNDLDGEVVNFFSVLRDNGEELQKLLTCTPYAREEYEKAYEAVDDPVERARRFCVRCWQGFSASGRYKNGFRSGQQENSPNPARGWSRLPDTLEEARTRLQGIQIECLPALELLDRYNTEDVFVYADPPYLPETRTQKYLYKHEMSQEDHVVLLEKLREHPGKVLLSGYDNGLYREMLPEWHTVQKKSQTESGTAKIETLWMNYEPEQLSLPLSVET